MKLFFGITLIIIGVFAFYYTYVNRNKGDDTDRNNPDFKGYSSAVLLIAGGIILIKKWIEMN